MGNADEDAYVIGSKLSICPSNLSPFEEMGEINNISLLINQILPALLLIFFLQINLQFFCVFLTW